MRNIVNSFSGFIIILFTLICCFYYKKLKGKSAIADFYLF